MDASDYMAARRVALLAAEAKALAANPVLSKAVRSNGIPRMLAGMAKASRLSTAYTNTIQKVAADCGPVVEKPTPCCSMPSPSLNTNVA